MLNTSHTAPELEHGEIVMHEHGYRHQHTATYWLNYVEDSPYGHWLLEIR